MAPYVVKRHDIVIAETARYSLIGPGGIDEAIANNPVTAFQCREDGFFDVIGSGCSKEECFNSRTPSIGNAFHQHATNSLCTRASARLPRCDDKMSTTTYGHSKCLELGRFANTLSALKRYETSALYFLVHPPKNDIKPAQTRPKKPASDTASSATNGMTCGAVSGVDTIKSAICCPFAIGALIGPS